MKNATTNHQTQNQNQHANNPRQNSNGQKPENKDNLDSRSSEEYDFKGDDITNNKKEHQSENKSQNKK